MSNNPIHLPTFICVGAQRAGTTWLYHCLKEHPEIYMPERKELRFFNYHYEDGFEAYSENFQGAGTRKVIGEITPDYYRQDYALLRISQDLSDVKLIFILRNPIDRAYSQYQLYHGTEYEAMSFRDTYLQEADLVEWGKYGDYLEFIYQHFDRERVLVIDYELLQGAPEEFLRQIFEFLEVDQGFIPQNLGKQYNKVIYPQAQALLSSIGMTFIIEMVKKSWVGDWIRNRQKQSGMEISGQDFDYLADQLRDDIQKLGKLMNADYTHWLRR